MIILLMLTHLIVLFTEITAANHADICTYAISHDSKIDQPVSQLGFPVDYSFIPRILSSVTSFSIIGQNE